MPKPHRLTPARRRSLAVASALACAALTCTPSAWAIDPFEIQVYDGSANAPGVAGLELHTNYVAAGVRDADPPELPMHRSAHVTLEPSLGLTRWWELGAYLQSAFRQNGTYDWAGWKLRSKFVTAEGFHPHVRLGVNLELSRLPETYDRDHWGSEVRPIAAWENDDWILAINPIFGLSLAGAGFREGPTFEPAGMVKRKLWDELAVGLEYYATLGPIAHPHELGAQQHYVYEVVDLLSVKHVEVNLGIGEGLTSASNGFVLKLILGYSFERTTARDVVSARSRPLTLRP